jgi:hypothetical protein
MPFIQVRVIKDVRFTRQTKRPRVAACCARTIDDGPGPSLVLVCPCRSVRQ